MEAIIELFDKITDTLVQLAELNREKAAAVRKDDLMALNEVLRQEQALTLAMRGFEQKRTELLSQFELTSVPLSDVPKKFPRELQLRAKNTVDRLQNEYQIYRSTAEVARDTLECNLHEIEKILSDAGVDPNFAPGYGAPDVDLPAPMKTDFHA